MDRFNPHIPPKSQFFANSRSSLHCIEWFHTADDEDFVAELRQAFFSPLSSLAVAASTSRLPQV